MSPRQHLCIPHKESRQPQRWLSNMRLVMSNVIQTAGGIRATSSAGRVARTAPAVRPVGHTLLERPLTMYAIVNGEAQPGPGVMECGDARLSLQRLWNDARPRCEQARTANAARKSQVGNVQGEMRDLLRAAQAPRNAFKHCGLSANPRLASRRRTQLRRLNDRYRRLEDKHPMVDMVTSIRPTPTRADHGR